MAQSFWDTVCQIPANDSATVLLGVSLNGLEPTSEQKPAREHLSQLYSELPKLGALKLTKVSFQS